MNWQVGAIIITIAVLIASTAIFLIVYERDVPKDTEDWWIEIHSGSNITKIPLRDFKSLPSVERELTLLGTGEDGKEHTYRGVSLSYIIEHYGGNDTETVRVEAVDYYSYRLSADDVRNEESIMLAYEKDGKGMKTKQERGEGPVRLIIPQTIAGEYNAQHCVKYVYRVDLL